MTPASFAEDSFRDMVAPVAGGSSGIGAVVFLGSPAASLVSATLLAADGSYMAG